MGGLRSPAGLYGPVVPPGLLGDIELFAHDYTGREIVGVVGDGQDDGADLVAIKNCVEISC